jgi:hypothetical protein
MFRPVCLLFVLSVLAVGAETPLRSAQKKVAAIEAGRYPSAGFISFNSQELLALGMEGVRTTAPGAIERPDLVLAHGGATGTALVDFDKLRETARPTSNSTESWLYSKIVTGVHPVSVSVEVSSSNGTMTVHPTSVTVSGVTLSGSALDFVISTFLLPRYPAAVVSKPFPLNKNIDRIEVDPQHASVYRRR